MFISKLILLTKQIGFPKQQVVKYFGSIIC